MKPRAAFLVAAIIGLAACGGGGSSSSATPTTEANGEAAAGERDQFVERLGLMKPFSRGTVEERTCLVDALFDELGERRTAQLVDWVMQGETTGRAITTAEATTAGAALVDCVDYRAWYTRADPASGVGIPSYECEAKYLDPGGFADIAAREFLGPAAAGAAPGSARVFEAQGACADPGTLRTDVARAASASWPLMTGEEGTCYANRRIADVGPAVAARTESRFHRSTAEARAMVDALATCADLVRLSAALLVVELPAARATCIAGRMTEDERRELLLGELTDDVEQLRDARVAELARACPATGSGG